VWACKSHVEFEWGNVTRKGVENAIVTRIMEIIMPFRPLKSFFATADELLRQDMPTLGGILLTHLKSYEGLNTVYQHAGLNRTYFRAMLENRNLGLGPLPKEPEYGPRQSDVTKRMMEAWNWLERQGLLIRNDQQAADWFMISSDGEVLLKSGELPAQKHLDESDLMLIADSRLAELRKLVSADFDFRKLIRLCEELNKNYSEKCYLATAMLTRGLLDHVPPLFGKKTFSEVANNYGGKSFKDTMQHLDGASRKVADSLLHVPIRKNETLPTAQQVNCAQQLDVLLSEIVRITG
jgi:hypothetical protein